jgi:hypothetical protein
MLDIDSLQISQTHSDVMTKNLRYGFFNVRFKEPSAIIKDGSHLLVSLEIIQKARHIESHLRKKCLEKKPIDFT